MTKEIICTVCPMGCPIHVEGNKDEITAISGYTCKRGQEYGRQEFLHPVRILTTTVRVEGGDALVPVRSEKPVPKELLMDCMDVIKKTTVKGPVEQYDVIIHDICGCGVDMVATGYDTNLGGGKPVR